MTQNSKVFELKSVSSQVTSTEEKTFEMTYVVQTSDTQSDTAESQTVSTGLEENEPIEDAEKDMDAFTQNLINSDF